jgi:hypothetical protein
MAISQNDPDNWPHNVYEYDPKPRGKTLNRTVFQWVTATVDRVFPGDSYGLKFIEDVSKIDEDTEQRTGGNIWNLYGEWNEKTGRSDGYKGYEYEEGNVVDVQLQLSETTRNDGSTGDSRSITRKPKTKDGKPGALNIRMNNEYARTAQPAADAPPETQQQQNSGQESTGEQEPRLTTDQRIAKAQALNIIKDLLVAGMTEQVGLTEEAGWVILRDEVMRLAQGKAVDLSYLSPLVQAAIENGGTVIEVKDSPPPDSEDAPEGENVEELPW